MLNIAIVGAGSISNWHMESLVKFPERCKIVAVVDIVKEKAEEKVKKFNLDAQVFESHTDMIKSGLKIDLVHNCTPPYVHASISIDCMDAKMNVLVEKPMATCLKECDEMLEAEKRNGVALHVIAQNRFRDIYMKLKNLSDEGLAGKIRVAHIESLWWRGLNYYDLWWRGTWEKEGGGPTLNHAVHHIDLVNWIYGELPQEVTAVISNVMHDNSEVEDISFAILKYADGALAQVTSSVVHHGENQRIELQCEKAKISASAEKAYEAAANISQPNGFPTGNPELVKELDKVYNSYPDLKHQSHAGQIENVLTSLETGEKPLITAQDGRRTIELITAIYKSGCTKQTVALPIAKDDDFYTFEGLLKNATRFYEKKEARKDLGEGIKVY